MNKAIFNQLYLDDDGTDSYIAADELNEPFATVVSYRRRQRPIYYRRERQNGARAILRAVQLSYLW